MKDRAGEFQLRPQLIGIADISVMGQSHLALLVIHLHGLAVVPVVCAGGAVTHMPHSHGSGRKMRQFFFRKDLAHLTQILMGMEDPILVHYDAAALLPAVLQGIQAVVHITGQIIILRGIDPH